MTKKCFILLVISALFLSSCAAKVNDTDSQKTPDTEIYHTSAPETAGGEENDADDLGSDGSEGSGKDKSDLFEVAGNSANEFEALDAEKIEYIKENADELFKAKIERCINVANYYHWGHYDMPCLIDEQKIALGIVENHKMDSQQQALYFDGKYEEAGFTVSKKDVEKTVAQYFACPPEKHMSIKDSHYFEAVYENGAYKMIRPPFVGAVAYYIEFKNIEVDKNEYVITCTADLLFIHAMGTDLIGESTIKLSFVNDEFKIVDYSQILLEDPIGIESHGG